MSAETEHALVALAAELGSKDTALGRSAREAAARDGALSAPMVEWALSTCTARYTPEACAACATGAAHDGAVALLLAVSVPVAPLRAIALPLLGGAREVIVRPSRRQMAFPSLLVRAFASRGLPVVLADASAPEAFVHEASSRGARVLVAHGNDATLEAVRRAMPPAMDFEGHGHGFGVALVPASHQDDPEAAAAVARDIACFDQHGCLSPQVVCVAAPDARPFAARLARALEDVEAELPRGPMDTGLSVRLNQWQGACAALAEAFHRGRTHAVAALGEPTFFPSPGARHIAVTPLDPKLPLASLLRAHARHLTCIGIAGARESLEAGSDLLALPEGATPRLVPAGLMHDPPLDGHEDPRPPMTR